MTYKYVSNKGLMLFKTLKMQNFEIVEICGQGSSSVIYKILNTNNNQFYALKENMINESDRIVNEEMDIGSHANIRKYIYIGHSKNSFSLTESKAGYNYYLSIFYNYTLREFIQYRNDTYFGTNHKQCITSYNNISLTHLKIMFIEIVKGTLYLHNNKKIHRDLKPENIFINDENYLMPVIGDFGLLKDVSKNPVTYSMDVGTVTYTAPETRSSFYSFKIDVFALGLIYFELLWPMKTQMERLKNFEVLRELNKVPKEFNMLYPNEAMIIESCVANSEEKRIGAKRLLKILLKNVH